MTPIDPATRREVHVARKEYRCEAPFGPCSRRILRGQPYTLFSFPPGSEPLRLQTWTNLRACSVCAPIRHEVSSTPTPCAAVVGGEQCSLDAHGPERDHEFALGLF
jgi:hypothetical protein